MKKKLLVFGVVLRDHPRNRVFLEGLEDVFELEEVRILDGLKGNLRLLGVIYRRLRHSDGMLFMMPTMRFSPTMWLVHWFTKKPIIGDAHISLFDTTISDRALAKPRSMKGVYYRLLDMCYVRACDALIFDTTEHEAYFLRTCSIPKRVQRFVVPVCVETTRIDALVPKFPTAIKDIPGVKIVIFHGGYHPLQGVQYIIEAVNLLRHRTDIRFIMIGGGQLFSVTRKKAETLKLPNIQFIGWMDFFELMAALKKADICLGIFGDTEKATRVIPNKLLEGMAAYVPVVCGQNGPIGRYFKDGEQIYFARLADAKDIAAAIERVLADTAQARRVAESAREVVDKYFSVEALKKNDAPRIRKWFDAFTKNNFEKDGKSVPPRIVVYTAIFGPKDRLHEPLVKPDNVDFVCFTDQDLTSRTWDVRRVTSTESDPILSARRYKILAHEYLPEYEASVWIDGNVVVRKDVNELFTQYLTEKNMAVFDHAQSKQVSCRSVGEMIPYIRRDIAKGKVRDSIDRILAQYQAYRDAGFRDDVGLVWSLVLVRRHNAPDVVRQMNAWWAELKKWTRRDQMSFNFVAWRDKFAFVYMSGDPADNDYFLRLWHYRSRGSKLRGHVIFAKRLFWNFISRGHKEADGGGHSVVSDK